MGRLAPFLQRGMPLSPSSPWPRHRPAPYQASAHSNLIVDRDLVTTKWAALDRQHIKLTSDLAQLRPLDLDPYYRALTNLDLYINPPTPPVSQQPESEYIFENVCNFINRMIMHVLNYPLWTLRR